MELLYHSRRPGNRCIANKKTTWNSSCGNSTLSESYAYAACLRFLLFFVCVLIWFSSFSMSFLTCSIALSFSSFVAGDVALIFLRSSRWFLSLVIRLSIGAILLKFASDAWTIALMRAMVWFAFAIFLKNLHHSTFFSETMQEENQKISWGEQCWDWGSQQKLPKRGREQGARLHSLKLFWKRQLSRWCRRAWQWGQWVQGLAAQSGRK